MILFPNFQLSWLPKIKHFTFYNSDLFVNLLPFFPYLLQKPGSYQYHSQLPRMIAYVVYWSTICIYQCVINLDVSLHIRNDKHFLTYIHQ